MSSTSRASAPSCALIGAIGGINYRCDHTGFKREFIQNGELTEQYSGSTFNEFNTFKADAMFGLEIGNTTIFVTHALVDMFKESYKYSAKPFFQDNLCHREQ